MKPILFLDTETTGKDADLAEIVELGFYLQSPVPEQSRVYSTLIKPVDPIPPESSAVHHITNAMVADAPPINDEAVVNMVRSLLGQADYICAHNLPYDLRLLERFFPDLFLNYPKDKCIDTLRLAKHVFRGLPSHSLQALRYRFDFADHKDDAHRAMADTLWVSDLLHLCIQEKDLRLDDIVRYINEPIMVEVMTFGKHRGMRTDEALAEDPGWFQWFLKQAWSTDHPDLVFTVKILQGKHYSKNN